MRFDRVKEMLPKNHRALIAGGATCYALVFGLLIYGLVSYVGLGSLRQPQITTVARHQPVAATPHAGCAEFAGMGQKLCNAEAKVEVARAKFQQRVAERKQRSNRLPAERISRAQDRPAPAPASTTPAVPARSPAPPPEVFPHPAYPLNSSIASRE